jgi:hypothetical protein
MTFMTIQRPQGMPPRTFERKVGLACQGTGATPTYNGRRSNSADIHGSIADQTLVRLKLDL